MKSLEGVAKAQNKNQSTKFLLSFGVIGIQESVFVCFNISKVSVQ